MLEQEPRVLSLDIMLVELHLHLPTMEPLLLVARSVAVFLVNSAIMFPDNSATMSHVRCPDRNVPMSQGSNARMFLVKSLAKTAAMSPDKNARMFPVNSVNRFQGSNVRMFPANSARMFPGSSARMFPNNSAAMSPVKLVRQCQGRSAKLVSLLTPVRPTSSSAS